MSRESVPNRQKLVRELPSNLERVVLPLLRAGREAVFVGGPIMNMTFFTIILSVAGDRGTDQMPMTCDISGASPPLNSSFMGKS